MLAIIICTGKGKSILVDSIGNIINITVDVIKHCVLFLACTPNAKKRNMLKNTRLIRKSLSIFNIIARANKMTNFTIVK